jgi:hypothetical protein
VIVDPEKTDKRLREIAVGLRLDSDIRMPSPGDPTPASVQCPAGVAF